MEGPCSRTLHRARLGRLVFGRGDIAEIPHSSQDVGAAHLGGLGIRHRIDRRGRGRDAGERGHLGNAELIQGLAEVHLGSRGHAIGALTEKDLVHVQGKDLFLAEFGFHQQRDVNLAHLALHVAMGRKEHVPRHLHGDRARALTDSPGASIGQRGAQNPLPINTMVTKEAVILGRQECLHQFLWQIRVAHRNAPLLADGGDQAAVAGVDPQRHLQLHLAQAVDIG